MTESFQTQCQFCGAVGKTDVDSNLSGMGWLLIVIFFFLGMWLCMLIPCFVGSLKDVKHSCGNCHQVIAKKAD